MALSEEASPSGSRRLARPAWWIEHGLRPVLIAGMIACLAALLGLVLRGLAPGWTGAYFPIFVFFACLEGILSERYLRERRVTGQEYWLARAAELVVLLLLLKLFNTLLPGLDSFRADLGRWLAHPGEMFGFTDLTLGPAMAVLWLVSLSMGQLARELDQGAGRGPAPADKSSTAYYLWLTQPPPHREREESLAQLASTFAWGGILALLSAAAAQAMGGAAVTLPTLLYFMLGLALLTQARFSVARGAWQLQDVPVEPSLGRRWLAWAAAFLLGIGLLALLLPTSLAEVPVQVVRSALLAAVSWLGYLAVLLLFLLSAPLMLLFPNMKAVQRPQAPEVSAPWAPAEAGSGSAPWLRLVGVGLFWLALAALLALALVRFLRDRWGLGRGERAGKVWTGWWQRLTAWLRGLWRRSAELREGVRVRLMGRRAAEGTAADAPARWLSLRRLTPAERVRFFYLSTARRAAEAGQPRAPGDTPYEYRSSLEERFPRVEPELDGLTEAFVAARYSRRRVETEDAERVKPLWQRIQAALRRERKSQTAGKPTVRQDEQDGAGYTG